jgi:hypothetical protein
MTETRTNRWLSLLVTLLLTAGPYVSARFFADDQLTLVFIGTLTTAVAGVLVPAAAAPFGTVDAVPAVPPAPPVPSVRVGDRPPPAMPQNTFDR